MNRRHFLGALAVVPAVVACPALANGPALIRGELGHWENVSILGDSTLVGNEETLTSYSTPIRIDQLRKRI